MTVTLESTSEVVHLDGIPARIWEGTTDSGIKVQAYITRMAVDINEIRQHQFKKEMQQVRPLSEGILDIPLVVVL